MSLTWDHQSLVSFGTLRGVFHTATVAMLEGEQGWCWCIFEPKDEILERGRADDRETACAEAARATRRHFG